MQIWTESNFCQQSSKPFRGNTWSLRQPRRAMPTFRSRIL